MVAGQLRATEWPTAPCSLKFATAITTEIIADVSKVATVWAWRSWPVARSFAALLTFEGPG